MLRYEKNATPFCRINHCTGGNCHQLQAQQGLGNKGKTPGRQDR